MKLKVRYATKERKWLSETTYQPKSKDAELSPVRIMRSPCGSGAAANRYRYQADFEAPKDAAFSHGGLMRTNIERKWNPKFNPKKLQWDGDVCNTPCA